MLCGEELRNQEGSRAAEDPLHQGQWILLEWATSSFRNSCWRQALRERRLCPEKDGQLEAGAMASALRISRRRQTMRERLRHCRWDQCRCSRVQRPWTCRGSHALGQPLLQQTPNQRTTSDEDERMWMQRCLGWMGRGSAGEQGRCTQDGPGHH